MALNPKCVDDFEGKILSLKERGKRMRFRNPDCTKLGVVRYDGCVVTNEKAVDYLILIGDVVSVVLEIKGKNIERALDQVLATMDRLKKCMMRIDRASIIIRGNQYPKSTTTINRKIEKIAKLYRRRVLVVTKDEMYCLKEMKKM